MVETRLYHDLIRITPEEGGQSEELKEFSVCENEPFSFQMAYKLASDPADSVPDQIGFFIRITSPFDVALYQVGCVPVMHSFSKIRPPLPIGMYPDILMPKKTNPEIKRQTICSKRGYRCVEAEETQTFFAYPDSWQQVWFTINENERAMPVGRHKVKIELFDFGYDKVGENELVIQVMNARLPEQSLYYTNWFHCDCLADYYDLAMFSDSFFAVMEDFLALGAKNGMNMVLLPAFTPPLDTPVGEERRTAQLVGVKRENGKYTFDFSLMKRYIDTARRAGIRSFEHSHFFTQWGAAHAPKILAEENGEKKKIFGWETDASGEEYVSFLRAYIPEMLAFLASEGLDKTTLFHVSDEPGKEHLETYGKAAAVVHELLAGYTVGDALSDVCYYETGLVKTPIARIQKAMDFVGKCDDLWVYYTGADCFDGLSNRLIQLPRERNRAMGYMLYYHKAKGFLHWAYNYYYGDLAHGLYNPAVDPCCGFPNAGTTYSVYPGRDKKPLPSIRQKIFAAGLVDMRALALLETLAGRKACTDLIEGHLGAPNFFNTPESPEAFLSFRCALNETIKESLKRKEFCHGTL